MMAALLATAAGGPAACGGGSTVKPAPPPLRPQARRAPLPAAQRQRSDCESVVPSDGPSPLSYEERSVEEAENLANQGYDLLQGSSADQDSRESEQMLEQAVHRFITALLADPYNVHATYNLAAAYARIGRGQCAVNLLSRLVPLRRLPSLAPKVEEKLDRLLGRKEYRGRLDPDFFELRDDPRFRDLVKNF
jgi:Plant specific mitochondrial import receptor subunit TOM20